VVINILFVIGGIGVILLGANLLVKGASSLAKLFNIPDLVIGLTIVAIGTSTPELVVNIYSAIKGNTGIAIGNILGSNIANILLIIGLSAIVYPLTVKRNTQYKEIPLGMLAIALIGICGNDILIDKAASNVISRIDGIILLCFFIIFMYYTFQIASSDDLSQGKIKRQAPWVSILSIIIGISCLFFAGKYFVEGAVEIAKYFGLSDTKIGLTIVAIGTSLPELATSLVAAYKKNPDIAVGNVVGSNIINVFLILGISAIIKPLPLQSSDNFDILVAFLASLMLFSSTFMFNYRKILRFEGASFVFIYVVYISYRLLYT
jgi:cation:H+ antiporter